MDREVVCRLYKHVPMKNIPSDVAYSMTAVPESCQFKLRVTRNNYTKRPLVRANRGSSDQVEISVTDNFFIRTCLNSQETTSLVTRSLHAYPMDLNFPSGTTWKIDYIVKKKHICSIIHPTLDLAPT